MAVLSNIFSFASLALYLTFFTAAVNAAPLDQIRREFTAALEEKTEVIKRAGTFPVTGVRDGLISTRLSLRMMQANNPDQFTLYLLAMHNFQWMPQNTFLSYYDVASIHGVPAVAWDGVQGSMNNGAPGYCQHSTPTFPGWHRVYLALFEQAFYAQAQATANSFTDSSLRSRYQAALKGLRLPYFDWAQGPGKASTVVPNFLTDKMITVPNPSGGSQTIINPLFRFDNHPLDQAGMLYNPWNFWPTTLRYPTADNTQNVVSQNNLMINAIQNSAQQLHDQAYNIFTQCSDYMEFSNDASTFSTPGCSNSLEGIHDSIHNLIGGSNKGHMTYLWWAAFDPAFWIHHVNVDRLYAMWQVLYPNSWITQGTAHAASYTYKAGITVNGDTHLHPFHRDANGNFWTTNYARYINNFGYTYTEVAQAGGSAGNMRNIVNFLYGGSSGSSKKRGIVDGLVNTITGALTGSKPTASATSFGNDPIANIVNNVINTLPKLSSNLRTLLTPTGRKHDYTANINVQRFGLDGSFTVYTFLGNHTTNPMQYAFDSNLVGSYGVFSNPGMQSMRVNGEPLVVSGSVPLTTALVAKVQDGELKSLNDVDVVPYLKKNLSWAVSLGDGTAVANSDVPGLLVSVVKSDVTPASNNDAFPVWKPFTALADITHGQAGGLQVI